MIMQTETKTELKNEGGMYTTSNGDKVTPKELAKTLSDAIEHYKNQIQTTKDVRKKKQLQDKLRSIKLWLAQHDDVKKYMQ
jgi:hypothetical protein